MNSDQCKAAGLPQEVELPMVTFKRLKLERLAVTGSVQQARSKIAKRRARAELLVLRIMLASLTVLAIAAVASPRWFR